MTARLLGALVGAFYLLTGAWAFVVPATFYSAIATFSPYNVHLVHDAGAFQIGMGASLVAAAAVGRGLAPVLLGVLAGSLLHLVAHLIDIRLGGHPSTDLPILVAIVVALATAFAFQTRSTNLSRRP